MATIHPNVSFSVIYVKILYNISNSCQVLHNELLMIDQCYLLQVKIKIATKGIERQKNQGTGNSEKDLALRTS